MIATALVEVEMGAVEVIEIQNASDRSSQAGLIFSARCESPYCYVNGNSQSIVFKLPGKCLRLEKRQSFPNWFM